MKKVINGHRYDTATAKFLGSDDYSAPGDFNWWNEELYRTNSGQFFLYGEGGPASKYAKTIDHNNWSGGEKIMELDEKSAQEWAEQHLSGKDYDAIWPEIPSDEVSVGVVLPKSIVDAMDARKDSDRCSRSDVIIKALKAYLG